MGRRLLGGLSVVATYPAGNVIHLIARQASGQHSDDGNRGARRSPRQRALAIGAITHCGCSNRCRSGLLRSCPCLCGCRPRSTGELGAAMASGGHRYKRWPPGVVQASTRTRLRPGAPARLALPRARDPRRSWHPSQDLLGQLRVQRDHGTGSLLAEQSLHGIWLVRRLCPGLVPVFGRRHRHQHGQGHARLPACQGPDSDELELVRRTLPHRVRKPTRLWAMPIRHA